VVLEAGPVTEPVVIQQFGGIRCRVGVNDTRKPDHERHLEGASERAARVGRQVGGHRRPAPVRGRTRPGQISERLHCAYRLDLNHEGRGEDAAAVPDGGLVLSGPARQQERIPNRRHLVERGHGVGVEDRRNFIEAVEHQRDPSAFDQAQRSIESEARGIGESRMIFDEPAGRPCYQVFVVRVPAGKRQQHGNRITRSPAGE
jgi:hypothetical protein